MLARIVDFSLRQRWVVLAATLVCCVLGFYNYQRLPIDAVPDITNVQVQINTEAPGYSPLEAEQRITFPIENALAGLPRLEHTRSISRYGLSQVTVVFEEGTDIYFARQLVGERLNEVRSSLPPGLEPSLGPIATGLGEIFMYTVTTQPGFEHSATDLRTVSANLYRDGRDSVAWHGDQIEKDVEEPLVALVSLGEPRRFLLRPRGGGRSIAVTLGRGDLLVTGGTTQRTWDHCVPKVARAGPRISIAFRHAVDRRAYARKRVVDPDR